MGTARIHWAPGLSGQLYERPAQRSGGVVEWEELGHTWASVNTVRFTARIKAK